MFPNSVEQIDLAIESRRIAQPVAVYATAASNVATVPTPVKHTVFPVCVAHRNPSRTAKRRHLQQHTRFCCHTRVVLTLLTVINVEILWLRHVETAKELMGCLPPSPHPLPRSHLLSLIARVIAPNCSPEHIHKITSYPDHCSGKLSHRGFIWLQLAG